MKRQYVLLSTILLLAGCVSTPTGNIEVFGDAARRVSDNIDAVLKEYTDEKVENAITKLAQHRERITVDSFDPVKKVLIGGIDKKNYAIYKANKALGSYAAALSGLARAGNRNEIDLAAANLYASLHGMNEQYKQIRGDDLIDDSTTATIGRVIAEIGSFYVEKKRGEALKTIIVAADKPVQMICEVISDELVKGTIQDRLFTIRHTELAGYIDDYNNTVAKAGFEDKKKDLDRIAARYKAMQGSSASVESAVSALQSIKTVHATLREELEKGRFTGKNLVRAIGALKDTQDHYDKLEEMMLSCKTKLVADDKKGGIICEKEQ